MKIYFSLLLLITFSSTFAQSRWTYYVQRTTGALSDIAGNGSSLVAVGRGWVSTSSSGTSWDGGSPGTSRGITAVVWIDDKFLATVTRDDAIVGRESRIMTSSTSGKSWGFSNSGITRDLYDLAWTGSLVVAVGEIGNIRTSPDGSTWTSRGSGTREDLHGVYWLAGQVVAVGDGGTILTSLDGVTWTKQNSGTSNTLYSAAWTGEKLVVVGRGIVLVSPDSGVTWRSTGAISGNAVVWTGKQLVAVGNAVYSSIDGGESWERTFVTSELSLYGLHWSGDLLITTGIIGGSGVIMSGREDPISGIENQILRQDVSLKTTPNLLRIIFPLSFKGGSVNARIKTVYGSSLLNYESQLQERELTLPLTNLASGSYLMQIIYSNMKFSKVFQVTR